MEDPLTRTRLAALALLMAGCQSTPVQPPAPAAADRPALAQIYYWRAKPGKFEEYSRYITQFAEKVDEEARREGAFLSVTTFASRDSTSPWTHMRIFVLRDSVQLRDLSAALQRAGARFQPDSAERRKRSQYSATLRDPAGSATVEVMP